MGREFANGTLQVGTGNVGMDMVAGQHILQALRLMVIPGTVYLDHDPLPHDGLLRFQVDLLQLVRQHAGFFNLLRRQQFTDVIAQFDRLFLD